MSIFFTKNHRDSALRALVGPALPPRQAPPHRARAWAPQRARGVFVVWRLAFGVCGFGVYGFLGLWVWRLAFGRARAAQKQKPATWEGAVRGPPTCVCYGGHWVNPSRFRPGLDPNPGSWGPGPLLNHTEYQRMPPLGCMPSPTCTMRAPTIPRP
jgi:hypothetical protein